MCLAGWFWDGRVGGQELLLAGETLGLGAELPKSPSESRLEGAAKGSLCLPLPVFGNTGTS